jgi:hypothetical protein
MTAADHHGGSRSVFDELRTKVGGPVIPPLERRSGFAESSQRLTQNLLSPSKSRQLKILV